MRHLVLISTSYPCAADGSEAAGSFVADFALALSQRFRISVLAPGIQSGVETISETLVVHRFAVPRLPLSLLKPGRPSSWPATLTTLVAGYKALELLVQGQSVAHIVALWALPSGYWAQKIGRRHGIPYSIWALGSDIWALGRLPLVKQVLLRVLRGSAYNFADGHQLKRDVELLAGRPCAFLPSTRDLGVLHLPALKSRPPYILAFLGRWHPNKGIDLLLNALRQLTDVDWQRIAEVRIAGGGPLRALVHQACGDLQARGRALSVQGYLDKQAAIKWLSSADYVLIPSRIESIPVVFSDAVKCGCPVVSMPVGDMPRLIAQYSVGRVSETVSADDFCRALRSILADAPVTFADGLGRVSEEFSVAHSVSILQSHLFGQTNPA